jgi:hypothetical protein
MLTGFEATERPVPYNPVTLMGAELQLGGWHVAYTDAMPGKFALSPPPELALKSIGEVDW